MGFLGGIVVKNSSANAGDTSSIPWVRKEMANQSSYLAWEFPWTEDPGGG